MSEDITPYHDEYEAQIEEIMELLEYSREEAEFISDNLSPDELEVCLMRVRLEMRWQRIKRESDQLFGEGEPSEIMKRLKEKKYSSEAIALCCVRESSGLNRHKLLMKLRKALSQYFF